ncbi:MAG: hypothetical protein HY247_05245 [archaeon]|nr:MAG: hypothetical protein HY247_05245 [archaeon]
MEHWVEVNLHGPLRHQDKILLGTLRPHVARLRKAGDLMTFHFFREPEIRFRVRLRTKRAKAREVGVLGAMARELVSRGLLRTWNFGNHGLEGEAYAGEEEDRYGKNGWKVAQQYFERGSEVALDLLALRARGSLESPLWAEGVGNPWEGGRKNPWRERVEDPLAFHWSRYVHLFSNQLGFDIDGEVELCRRQARNYGKVSRMGMKW